MALRHALAIAIAVIGFGAAGCSSGRSTESSRIPFPVGVDDCSVYCRVWVPPTYRDVPKVVCCKPGRLEREVVCAKKVEFDEVCRPGSYVKKCLPCRCHTEEAYVPDCPGSHKWVPTTCGCTCEDCFRYERTPPTYKLCEKTVTDKGVEYCAYHEPEYDVVACAKTVKECVDVYKPGSNGRRNCSSAATGSGASATTRRTRATAAPVARASARASAARLRGTDGEPSDAGPFATSRRLRRSPRPFSFHEPFSMQKIGERAFDACESEDISVRERGFGNHALTRGQELRHRP